jgi:hypothetical protein
MSPIVGCLRLLEIEIKEDKYRLLCRKMKWSCFGNYDYFGRLLLVVFFLVLMLLRTTVQRGMGWFKRLHAFNMIMGREMKIGLRGGRQRGVRNRAGKGDRFFPFFPFFFPFFPIKMIK